MTISALRATPAQIPQCLELRKAVFVDEQQIDAALEFDGLDEEARHYIALHNGKAVGTGRVRLLGSDAKVERFAVLAEARKLGVGRAVMQAILNDLAQEAGLTRFVLSAQDHAIPFYEKLGFVCITDWYEEAGIPHRKMEKRL